MIIYCAGPIRGDVKYRNFFKEIINYLVESGHTALTELNDIFHTSIPLTNEQIFKRDIKWLEKSKLVIAEVSGPSLGTGFEIAYSLYNLRKPVLAVAYSNAGKISAMIDGCNNKHLTLKYYADIDELKKILSNYLDNEK